MVIRTFETDQTNPDGNLTGRLNQQASPAGGDYGWSRSSGRKIHTGWDLAAKRLTSVFAISEGVVEWALHGLPVKDPRDYGNRVCIRLNVVRKITQQPLWAFYAHLDNFIVKEGDPVQEGQVI